MKQYTIGTNDAEQRLDRFLSKAESLPSSAIQKYIRTGKIKVNSKKAAANYRLQKGDIVSLYIVSAVKVSSDEIWREITSPKLNILYEDNNIILIIKPKNLLCQPDSNEVKNTLSSYLKAYLYQKHEWIPESENSFAPSLCNRIDRNTEGIVIAAKSAESLRIITEKIRNHELTKSYLCVVHHRPKTLSGTIENFLLKDAAKNRVEVYTHPAPGALKAITKYKVLRSCGSLSLVECELITGRTHQIRAQMANLGCPLLGDNKYGLQKFNRPYNVYSQVLLSYKLSFNFITDAGILNYLSGNFYQIDSSDFIKEYELYAQHSTEQ